MEKVHVSELEFASNAGKQVEVDAVITGKGEPLQVPCKFHCSCAGYEITAPGGMKQTCDGCKQCEFYGKGVEKILDVNDPIYYRLIHQSEDRVMATVKRHLTMATPLGNYDGCRQNLLVKTQDVLLVRPVQIAPKVNKLEQNAEDKKVIDESGKEYKEIIAYIVGDHDLSKQSYTLRGSQFSLPMTQKVAFWATEVSANQDMVDNFVLTDPIKVRLLCLIPDNLTVDVLDDRFNKITESVTYGITNIYGYNHQRHALGATLLAYASPKELFFDGQFLPRAALNVLIVGDTGQGKSKLVDNLVSRIGLGMMVNGGAAGRTGLLYNLDSVQNNSRMLRWGVMPLNTGRLVAVDEAQRFKLDEWAEMTRARSEGKIEVNKSKHGEHEMKTRLVFIANPKDVYTSQYKQVAEYVYGIEAAKIMNDQDLRRFDVVVIIAAGDATTEEVNQLKAEQQDIPLVYTSDLIRDWVCWAWSKKYSQRDTFVYRDRAEETIREVSSRLMAKFRADAIPLLIEDTKEKVARLSAAAANLMPVSIDDKVHITPEHVKWVEQWLGSNYTHRSNALDKYAAKQRAITTLSDEEYTVTLEKLSSMKDGIGLDIIQQFEESEIITSLSLANALGIAVSTMQSSYIPPLRDLGLIRSRRGGYSRTPKLVKFIRRLKSI